MNKHQGVNIVGKIAITGGLGFIGSAFIRKIRRPGVRVLNIDLDTYAGDEQRLAGASRDAVQTHRIDIVDPLLAELLKQFRPDIVVHFAAESHVTRSETDSVRFHRTNVEGTRNVLEASTQARASLVVHVSTDEVYGPCTGAPFSEDKKLLGEGLATSPYARSKALADDLARSWGHVPVIVVRPTNCFGPWQHPEKAIPRWTIRALDQNPVPVWGDGHQVRDWMFVDDACGGIELLIERGTPGDVYNLGPQEPQRTNVAMAQEIAKLAGSPDNVYLTAYDRPDHDRRYAIDARKIQSLGWAPSRSLEQRLNQTVEWYRTNRWWWSPLLADAESIYDDALERR
jgi:dTDP-glucose 4,6-dehydratase